MRRAWSCTKYGGRACSHKLLERRSRQRLQTGRSRWLYCCNLALTWALWECSPLHVRCPAPASGPGQPAAGRPPAAAFAARVPSGASTGSGHVQSGAVRLSTRGGLLCAASRRDGGVVVGTAGRGQSAMGWGRPGRLVLLTCARGGLWPAGAWCRASERGGAARGPSQEKPAPPAAAPLCQQRQKDSGTLAGLRARGRRLTGPGSASLAVSRCSASACEVVGVRAS